MCRRKEGGSIVLTYKILKRILDAEGRRKEKGEKDCLGPYMDILHGSSTVAK